MARSQRFQVVTSLGAATVGQVLNLLAMVLPILVGETAQVAFLIYPLAISVVAYRVGYIGFHVRYLAVERHRRGVCIAASFVALLVTTAVIALIGAALLPFSVSSCEVAVYAALLTLSQGVYHVGITLLIGAGEQKTFGRARLVFGVVNVALTAVAVFITPFDQALAIATIVLNAVIGTGVIAVAKTNFAAALKNNLSAAFSAEGRRYLNDSKEAVGGLLLTELGGQAQGLVTPLMGPLAEFWAVLVRLCGGFGTVGMQVVAPFFEMKVAADLESSRTQSAFGWVRKSQFVSLVFAVMVAAGQTVLLVLVFSEGQVSVTAMLLGALFTAFSMGSIISVKMPYLMGHDRWMVYWSVARLAFIASALYFQGLHLLIAMVVVQGIFAVLNVLIVLRPPQQKAS